MFPAYIPRLISCRLYALLTVSAGRSAADLQADVLAGHSMSLFVRSPGSDGGSGFGPWGRGQPGEFRAEAAAAEETPGVSSGAQGLWEETVWEGLRSETAPQTAGSVDSLDTGELTSLSETPGDTPTPKAWGREAGVLSLDLSQVHLFDRGDSGSQTPGSMQSTPSPLENAKPFPGASSLNDDCFLFSDNVSLGESFNSEVRTKI